MMKLILKIPSAKALLCLLALAVVAPGHARPKKVIYLGDSLSMGDFGQSVDASLREAGFETHTFVAGGASPYYWLEEFAPIPSSIGFWKKTPSEDKRVGYIKAVPKMEALMRKVEPDFVVVQLGVNLYSELRSKRRSKEDNVKLVESLITKMCQSIKNHGAKFFWVLPPDSHEEKYPAQLQEELELLMTKTVRGLGGEVFQSQLYTEFVDPYPQTDGIHYGKTEALAWAQRLIPSLSEYIAKGELRVDPESLVVHKAQPIKTDEIVLRATPVQIDEAVPRAKPVRRAKLVQRPGGEIPVALAARVDQRSTNPTAEKTTRPGASKKFTQRLSNQEDPGGIEEPVAASQKVQKGQLERYQLSLRLIGKSEMLHLNETPYSNALGIYEYAVLKDRIGNYPFDKIRIAHGVKISRKATQVAHWELGKVVELSVVRLSNYPSLERWETVDALPLDLDMPIYTPKLK